MNSGAIICGIVMMFCAVLFYGIGIWAQKRKDPMHFWSGSTVDPKKISDVAAYNRANGRMWKIYSAPYWLGALASVLGFIDQRISVLSPILLVLACTVGLCWLPWQYSRICKQYMNQPAQENDNV